ncbi:hypothetical protein [Flavobacterium aciduliphilum]|uniref:Porin n=1 Tax=Flavobacterium aciduliphilum TaxID=1101402 RepID=A0A328YF26_9FLAO|nr:hypothetical protein [Flavobacterium aciduliphilum]RAR72519.1 hypothetical protein CLV55_10586 [Flavobacterium aciduliphilum]
MKTIIRVSLVVVALFLTTNIKAQTFGNVQNLIPRNKDGINVFDVRKDSAQFKGVSVYLGGAFALQFQALNSFNDQDAATLPSSIVNYRLNNLSNNLNLPIANMTFGAQLADGVRVNLDLYLSARHHNETWVKGGYLQIDKLDFIKKDFLKDFMKYATIKVGQMENNYGDAHFRRSDNGSTLVNPFIENNIMDAFITEPGVELYYNRSGFVSMLGVTNSKLNQNVAEFVPNAPTATAPNPNTTVSPTILAKFGYDKQIDKDLRIRLTGSLYHVSNMSSALYASDRAGSHYYAVMTHQAYTGAGGAAIASNFDVTANKDTGRFNPNFGNWATSIMINPFIKYRGLELFGTLEFASGGDYKGTDETRKVNQYAGDVLYRFGTTENFFVGLKYNTVTGKLANADTDAISINRIETSVGWFMTKNILAKLAYINQNYKNFSQFTAGNPNDFYGGRFNGLMFESVITF